MTRLESRSQGADAGRSSLTAIRTGCRSRRDHPVRRGHAEELGFLDLWVSGPRRAPGCAGLTHPLPLRPPCHSHGAAAVTERIGLGTSVLVVPMHNPLRTREFAGQSRPPLRRPPDCPPRVSGWLRNRSIGAWVRLFTIGESVSTRPLISSGGVVGGPAQLYGRFTSFNDVRLLPKPSRQIPIWIGRQRAGPTAAPPRRGNGFQAVGLTPEAARVRSSSASVRITPIPAFRSRSGPGGIPRVWIPGG